MKWCCGTQLEVLVGDAVQVSTASIIPIPVNLFAHGVEADTGQSKTSGLPQLNKAFATSLLASLIAFSAGICLASLSSILPMETTKGVKERRYWKQGSKYFAFLLLAAY